MLASTKRHYHYTIRSARKHHRASRSKASRAALIHAHKSAYAHVMAVKTSVDNCMKSEACYKHHMNKLRQGRECLKDAYCAAVTTHMMGDAWIRHSLQMCFWSKRTCVLNH